VVVAGTGTEVGKTWVADHLARCLLTAGHAVSARKPVQSFDPADAGPTDAEILGAATGESPHDVCPAARWYPWPMAPPMAAAALGSVAPIMADLVAELDAGWGAEPARVGLVETAGGVRSPLAMDGDSAALVAGIGPDLVVLVADAGLGAINAVRLAAGALAGSRVIVHLNRHRSEVDLHRRNALWLREVDALSVTTTVDGLAGAVLALLAG